MIFGRNNNKIIENQGTSQSVKEDLYEAFSFSSVEKSALKPQACFSTC